MRLLNFYSELHFLSLGDEETPVKAHKIEAWARGVKNTEQGKCIKGEKINLSRKGLVHC
jgi:hypothetical protein